MTGIQLIEQERSEQLNQHNWTLDYDKNYNHEYQLLDAATALLMAVPEGSEVVYQEVQGNHPPVGWNKEIWQNMINKPYKERLTIAGALIAAEIDRVS